VGHQATYEMNVTAQSVEVGHAHGALALTGLSERRC
jgi:hypothetical protein